MLLENRPETLHLVARDRQRRLLAEANEARLCRMSSRGHTLPDRLARRLGVALCAWGNRLQSRGPLLGK